MNNVIENKINDFWGKAVISVFGENEHHDIERFDAQKKFDEKEDLIQSNIKKQVNAYIEKSDSKSAVRIANALAKPEKEIIKEKIAEKKDLDTIISEAHKAVNNVPNPDAPNDEGREITFEQ